MFPSASVLLSDEVANLPSSGDPTAVPYKLYSLLFDPSLSFPPLNYLDYINNYKLFSWIFLVPHELLSSAAKILGDFLPPP